MKNSVILLKSRASAAGKKKSAPPEAVRRIEPEMGSLSKQESHQLIFVIILPFT